MKVILNADVENLGEEGDVVTVAPGYARNYLLPKGLVIEHNERNIAAIESRRADIEARRADRRKEAQSLKERLESDALVVTMSAGANGRLFGAVTSATIVEQLAHSGIELERKALEVPGSSLKSVGTYRVRVRLYGGEEAQLTVRVEATGGAATRDESVPPTDEEAPVEAESDGADAVAETDSDDSEDAAEEADDE